MSYGYSESWESSENLTIKSKYLRRGKKISARLNEEQKKQSIKKAKIIVS